MGVKQWQDRLYRDPAMRNPLIPFFRFLEGYLRPDAEVLDLGAGAGLKNTYAFRGKVKRLVGIDLDPRVRDNPLLDEGVVGDLTAMPFADNRFDVAFSIYVLEHIAEPASFLQELRRVLRPGGYFIALTPNRYHYVSLVSALTPTRFHKWYTGRLGRQENDTFPTHYRLNSRGALVKTFARAGFTPDRMESLEIEPGYLTFCTPAYLLGAVYEKVVNSSEVFSPFRVNILCAFRNQEK